MALETVTDEQIDYLIRISKTIMNPSARFTTQCGHQKKNFKVTSVDGDQFTLYTRQNMREEMRDAFSCGLIWHMKSGEDLTLRRYNGPAHIHMNKLEREKMMPCCHIHYATERYILAGLTPEMYAEQTKIFRTLDGALHMLVTECNISGIQTTGDNNLIQTELF